ncbi:MAG TPA: SIS domain-containing protein [Acidimicrobiales bacterium]|nr:SIS domain-containing protein [Acidimicrobiales bacterium]
MPETTDFLYPFIEGDETDAETLLEDLARSATAKWRQSSKLRDATLSQVETQLQATAVAMAERFTAGGRLFTFGNGGSATDAEAVAHLYTQPPAGRADHPAQRAARALPARSLAEDQAVMTALGNDVGFELVFSRQLIAHGRAHDIAMGFSTSGNSDNLMRAFAEARKQGMLTVGIAGTDGGRMAAEGSPVEQCFVVRSDSVHRIQESQAALNHALWAAVQAALA